MNKNARTYVASFGTAMAVYAVAVIVSILLLKSSPGAPWRYPAALLPMIPLAFALLAFIRFLNGLDELQRRIQLTAIGFTFGALVMVSLTVGFLENAGLPRPSWIWIAPAAIAIWGLSLAVATNRYR